MFVFAETFIEYLQQFENMFSATVDVRILAAQA